jgi:hypothetical protein
LAKSSTTRISWLRGGSDDDDWKWTTAFVLRVFDNPATDASLPIPLAAKASLYPSNGRTSIGHHPYGSIYRLACLATTLNQTLDFGLKNWSPVVNGFSPA